MDTVFAKSVARFALVSVCLYVATEPLFHIRWKSHGTPPRIGDVPSPTPFQAEVSPMPVVPSTLFLPPVLKELATPENFAQAFVVKFHKDVERENYDGIYDGFSASLQNEYDVDAVQHEFAGLRDSFGEILFDYDFGVPQKDEDGSFTLTHRLRFEHGLIEQDFKIIFENGNPRLATYNAYEVSEAARTDVEDASNEDVDAATADASQRPDTSLHLFHLFGFDS